MSVGGIGGGPGHIGAAQSTRTSNMLGNIGSAAFDTLVGGASMAAGAFGGPAAASVVNSFRGAASTSGGADGAVGEMEAHAKDYSNNQMDDAAKAHMDATSQQAQLIRLQASMNLMSQTNNTISGMQKARHDAMMATIQNIR